jgi:hypothetical protein
MKLNVWHLYLRNGMVYVPTVAQAEAGGHLGYFMNIDPVEVVSVAETEALQRAIKEAMSKGNPVVPAPTRATFPKPVMLKYAKVKSWSAFEKGTLPWTIEEKSGVYQIKPGRRRPDRGWEEDPTKIESLPPGTTLDEVAKQVIALIQLSGGVTSPETG